MAIAAVGPTGASAYWSPGAECGSLGAGCYEWIGKEGATGSKITATEFEVLARDYAAMADVVEGTAVPGGIDAGAGATLAEDLAAVDGTSAAGGEVLAGAEATLEGAGAVSAFSAIGTVALAAGAGVLGYKIGGVLGEMIGLPGFTAESEVSAEHYYAKGNMQAVSPGQNLCAISSCEPGGGAEWVATGKKTLPRAGFLQQVKEKCCSATYSPETGGGVVVTGLVAGATFIATRERTIKTGPYTGQKAYTGVYFSPVQLNGVTIPANISGSTSGKEVAAPSTHKTTAEKMASAKGILQDPQFDGFNEWAPHHGAKSGLAPALSDPTGAVVSIPNCDGLGYSACETKIEERHLVPQRGDLNWSEVQTTVPDEVVELQPQKATEVEKGTTVVVTTNPPEEKMPLIVPRPGDHETYAEYIAKLNPSLKPYRVNVGELDADPDRGPNGVLSVEPSPDTRLNPATDHYVQVRTNPASLPGAPGPWSPPTIPALDLSPLTETGLGCGVFPFGLPCWIGEAIGMAVAPAECLKFEGTVAGEDLVFDGCVAEPIMPAIRAVLLFLSVIGIVVYFGALGLGRGDPE
ncbi:MAG TPA: hypothetical protein VFM94_03600 [Solirubrobacterales bacterium]|nr:hypothetical protein [Solirubrobacterales bacterium]